MKIRAVVTTGPDTVRAEWRELLSQRVILIGGERCTLPTYGRALATSPTMPRSEWRPGESAEDFVARVLGPPPRPPLDDREPGA